MKLETKLPKTTQDGEQAQPSVLTKQNLDRAARQRDPETWEVGELDRAEPFIQHHWAEPASVRGYVTLSAVLIFAVTVGWAGIQAGGTHWAQTKDLLLIVLPFETGILGSALTYFFNTRTPH
jgi:hypothetical protein